MKLTVGIFIFIIIVIVIIIILAKYIKPTFIYTKNCKQNTYISMTTIPERIKTDWWYETLKRNMSFLDYNQCIIINIPYISMKGENYIIPDQIYNLQKNNPKNLILNRVGEDEGPITKLLPSLRNNIIKDSDTIIVCDDDLYYKPNVFNLLENAVNLNSNNVYAMCHNWVEGFKGFSFKKSLLKNMLHFHYPKSCTKVDDDIINFYININNIKVEHIPYDNETDPYCSILYEEGEENRHEWYELRNHDRAGHVLNCETDFKMLL